MTLACQTNRQQVVLRHDQSVDEQAYPFAFEHRRTERRMSGPAHGSRANTQDTAMSARKTTVSADPALSPAGLIDAKIQALGDWHGELLARLRALITQAGPGVIAASWCLRQS